MGWSRHGSGFRRRGYHHGNLREDLIRAALDLIAAKGDEAPDRAPSTEAVAFAHLMKGVHW